jgi:hypothetical protein
MHRSRLPVLQPCDQDWAQMPGTATRRHCGACDREVLHLSAMTAEAAIDALIARNGQACVRYRSDAAGEIEFAPAAARRAGPIAVAALALSACAGWAEDPEVVPPGELGMCVPNGDEPDACDDPDARPPAHDEPADPPPAQEEPAPPPPTFERSIVLDHASLAKVEDPATTTGYIAVVSSAGPAPSRSDDGHRFGVLVVARQDPTRSLFDRDSTAGPGRDWEATAELLRMKRQLRREERQRRREARRR